KTRFVVEDISKFVAVFNALQDINHMELNGKIRQVKQGFGNQQKQHEEQYTHGVKKQAVNQCSERKTNQPDRKDKQAMRRLRTSAQNVHDYRSYNGTCRLRRTQCALLSHQPHNQHGWCGYQKSLGKPLQGGEQQQTVPLRMKLEINEPLPGRIAECPAETHHRGNYR